MYIGLFALLTTPAPKFAAPALIAGVFIYIPLIPLAYMVRPRFAQYNSFRAIRDTVPKVNPALGTVLASDKRKALAEALIRCSDSIRTLGPRAPLGLPGKVIRQQAIQASQVLRHLVYPAMLGSDQELEAIRSVLGPASLKIGTSDWVRIGELTVETGQYQTVKTGLRAPRPLGLYPSAEGRRVKFSGGTAPSSTGRSPSRSSLPRAQDLEAPLGDVQEGISALADRGRGSACRCRAAGGEDGLDYLIGPSTPAVTFGRKTAGQQAFYTGSTSGTG